MNLQTINPDFKSISKQFPLIIFSDIIDLFNTGNQPIGYITPFENDFRYSIYDDNNIWPTKDFVLKLKSSFHLKIVYYLQKMDLIVLYLI